MLFECKCLRKRTKTKRPRNTEMPIVLTVSVYGHALGTTSNRPPNAHIYAWHRDDKIKRNKNEYKRNVAETIIGIQTKQFIAS